MKTKKHSKAEHQTHQRQSISSKSHAITNRKVQKSNKQNLIQITQPLDANPQTYPSKQFILSKQSCNQTSKTALRQVSANKQHHRPPKAQQSINNQQKCSTPFDRRLSLKCTGNFSQQLDYQKSQRLSMAPLRRQSLGQTMMPQSILDEKQSMSSMYQHSLMSSDSKSKLTIKKETIMANLMNKLDHEEDLRSIIELKLKNGANMSQFSVNQKKNSSYITDFTTDQHQNNLMATKLQQCENQIIYFKSVIKEMSQKIVQLTEDRKFKRKTTQKDSPYKQQSKLNHESDILSLVKRINTNCPKCQQKQSKTVATQVDPSLFRIKQQQRQPCDFLDNLQKTLKVLDGSS